MPKSFYKNEKDDNFFYKSNKSPFNSKLLFNIGIDTFNDIEAEEIELNNSFDSKELESKNNKEYFLLTDLIKELDSSFSEKTNLNNKNFTVSNLNYNNNYYLINNNILYPFINIQRKNNICFPLISSQKMKGRAVKKLHEKKGDWVCGFCKNLNFSFRTKCNRCKASKKKALKKE